MQNAGAEDRRSIEGKQSEWHEAFDAGLPAVEILPGNYRPFILTNGMDCGVVVATPDHDKEVVESLQRCLLNLIAKDDLPDALDFL